MEVTRIGNEEATLPMATISAIPRLPSHVAPWIPLPMGRGFSGGPWAGWGRRSPGSPPLWISMEFSQVLQGHRAEPVEPWESSGRWSRGKPGISGGCIERPLPALDPRLSQGAAGSGKGLMPTRRQGPSACPVPVSPCARVTAPLASPIPASPITLIPGKRDSGFLGNLGRAVRGGRSSRS